MIRIWKNPLNSLAGKTCLKKKKVKERGREEVKKRKRNTNFKSKVYFILF